ncbi:MAG: 2-C-methyl-D-erythritol 4-phosphate cytidylyltransferase [Halieaceae bacterium]
MSRLWAVVPAAGSGSRMGSATAKQYLRLLDRSVLEWSVGSLLGCELLEACAVALPAADVANAAEGLKLPILSDPRVLLCSGGDSRAASVAAALAVLPAEEVDWVLVHDAARPCLRLGDLDRLIAQVLAIGIGGLLAQPLTDTLKRSDGQGRVLATVDREGLWRAQTPQMFRIGELRRALATAAQTSRAVTDEASAMEMAGYPVQLVEGHPSNLKVTYAADLVSGAAWLVEQMAAQGRA